MEPLAYHIMCRLRDRRVIAQAPAARRQLSRIVLEKLAHDRLLAFNCPDTHLHIELVEPRSRCGELVRRIEISIKGCLRLPVGFSEPELKPIFSQEHLYQAFHYILNQEPHHGLERDPYHEASNLSDLLGLRLLGVFTAQHVRELLPRIKREDLLVHLGITADQWQPASSPVEFLQEATLAAAGLGKLGRDAASRRARRAAMEVAGSSVTQVRLAEILGVDRTTLGRQAQELVDEQLVKAIRLQLGLRQIRSRPPSGPF